MCELVRYSDKFGTMKIGLPRLKNAKKIGLGGPGSDIGSPYTRGCISAWCGEHLLTRVLVFKNRSQGLSNRLFETCF
jgi:hypothetical protein